MNGSIEGKELKGSARKGISADCACFVKGRIQVSNPRRVSCGATVNSETPGGKGEMETPGGTVIKEVMGTEDVPDISIRFYQLHVSRASRDLVKARTQWKQ